MKARNRRILWVVVGLAVALPVYGRMQAWWSAVSFGNIYTASFHEGGKSGFSDTSNLKSRFETSVLKVHYNRAERLRFLGGGYSDRMDEFKQGMIYLSGQSSLPTEQRFVVPPKLSHFMIDRSDRTEQGVFEAASKMVADYNRQISTP